MHADLLFTVPLDGNRPALLYLLFEHQSTVDPIMPLRLLGYMQGIYENWHKNHGLPLPPVLPFVLHQGPEAWTVSTSFEDLFQLPAEHSEEVLDFLPKFRHALLDLSQANPASEESDTRLQVILHLMKLARINQIHEYFRWLVHGLREQISDGLMARALFYALQAEGGLDAEDIYRILSPNPTLERQAMSVAEKLIARGRHAGLEEGRQEGRAGIQRILRHQLQRKFGELPEWTEARLDSATLENLESWGERILDAVILEDVFG